METRRILWPEFYSGCEQLAEMIAERYQDSSGRWSSIQLVGVLRGGGIVASILSYLLERRFAVDNSVDVIGIRRYADDVREAQRVTSPTVYHRPDNSLFGDFVVLVDEIATTGITIGEGKRVLEGTLSHPKVHTACLFSVGEKYADDVVEVVPEGIWVDFPWDAEEV